MTSLPFVSVIVLNYNGERFLPACLDALRMQTYPADHFEVIVADNGSTDGSLHLLREAYPWVRVHETGSNLGFAGGNNAAIAVARGDYIVLLNNDTTPAQDWLEQLVAVAERHPRAGIVTGRMRLFYDQLEVELCCDHELRVFEVDAGLPLGVVQYLDGFGGWEFDACGARFRRTRGGCGVIGVPVPHGPGSFTLRVRLAAQLPATATICSNGQTVARVHLTPEPQNLCLEIPSSIAATARPVMQNAGSVLFTDGHSRDRGVIVKNNEALYETDRDQFNVVEEVFAGCGGNMLMRRAMLNDVGLLDDDFFMYYEDTDLSWRARLRGWQVLYAPNAVVRHVHCGSSKEWSPLFLFNVEHNRLAMLIKNGAPRQAMGEFARYTSWAARSLVESSAAALLARPGAHERRARALLSMRVVGALMISLPSLLRKRAHIQRTRITPQREIEKWFQVTHD
ncbi:MAG: glycosyltransferase family 2 protein [Anaerolineae bacterium]|nr:glycosyltransferase family 2 protein [Candidatus Roseilinea sp.]MDW8448964.1 glycosyltransferase family 2 protein [Anaerolineae bacterium]